MPKIRYIYKDRTKRWRVVCDGKTISKHITFLHAQNGVERHLRTGKINNNYEILHIESA